MVIHTVIKRMKSFTLTRKIGAYKRYIKKTIWNYINLYNLYLPVTFLWKLYFMSVFLHVIPTPFACLILVLREYVL